MSRAREFADLAGSADAGGLTGRNLIINGAMQVAQRGTSFAQAGGATTYHYTIDRFKYEQAIEQWAGTMSQSTDVPSSLDASFKYSLKIQTTTVETTIDADDFAQIVYYFEGNDGERLGYGTSNARVSTLSFYVRSSVTGTYCLGLSNQDGSRTLPLEYTVSVADTWQRIELTVPACIDGTWGTGSNKHLGIRWMLGKPGTNFDGGTNGVWASDTGYQKLYTDQSNMVDWLRTASSTLYITGVQLEVGEQATPFEHRLFADELARCQRYYEKSYDYDTATGTAAVYPGNIGLTVRGMDEETSGQRYFTNTMRVEKRADPTNTFYDDAGNSGKVTTFDSGGTPTNNVSIALVLTQPSMIGCGPGNSAIWGYAYFYESDAEL